jgi:hypothetical protein
MSIVIDTRTGPVIQSDGAGDQPLRQSRMGGLVVTDAHGRYFEQGSRRNLFRAHAIVTAPVIYTTAAGTGGPLLWNSSSTVNCAILSVGFGVTVVTTVAAALGLTGNTGQTSAPTATTAIDSSGNCYIGGPPSACTAFRVGTPTNAGNFFFPFADLHTGALTVDNVGMHWIDIGGCIIVPPGAWCSIAASATATTAVGSFGLMWEEVPTGL